MGTRRAKHNMGRKPLYKDFDRPDRLRWSDETASIECEKQVPLKRGLGLLKIATAPDLIPLVEKYLASRKVEPVGDPERRSAAKEFPDRLIYSGGETILNDHLIGVSDRDFLLQLYVEKKIHHTDFLAGRLWQHYAESAALQPDISIDPGLDIRDGKYWQRSGDITEKQHTAMMTRAIAERTTGRAGREFLDRILQPDVGRAALIRGGRAHYERCFKTLKALLVGLAIFFRLSTGVNEAHGRWQKGRNDLRDYRIKNALQYMSEGQPNVEGLLRTFDYEDQQFLRGMTAEIEQVEAAREVRSWRSPDQTTPKPMTRLKRGAEYGVAFRG